MLQPSQPHPQGLLPGSRASSPAFKMAILKAGEALGARLAAQGFFFFAVLWSYAQAPGPQLQFF